MPFRQPISLSTVLQGSQRELASRLGIDQGDLSRIVREKRVLPLHALESAWSNNLVTDDEVLGLLAWMMTVHRRLRSPGSETAAPSTSPTGA